MLTNLPKLQGLTRIAALFMSSLIVALHGCFFLSSAAKADPINAALTCSTQEYNQYSHDVLERQNHQRLKKKEYQSQLALAKKQNPNKPLSADMLEKQRWLDREISIEKVETAHLNLLRQSIDYYQQLNDNKLQLYVNDEVGKLQVKKNLEPQKLQLYAEKQQLKTNDEEQKLENWNAGNDQSRLNKWLQQLKQ